MKWEKGMTSVALVESHNVVRVTPQSEGAVPASFSTWTEAMAYCKAKKYRVFNEVEAEKRCLKEMDERETARQKGNNEALAEVERLEAEAQGGEGSDA